MVNWSWHLMMKHSRQSWVRSVESAADDYRAVCVVHDVVTNTAHDGASHAAQTPRSYHYHRHRVVLCRPADHLARLAASFRLHEAAYLYHTCSAHIHNSIFINLSNWFSRFQNYFTVCEISGKLANKLSLKTSLRSTVKYGQFWNTESYF